VPEASTSSSVKTTDPGHRPAPWGESPRARHRDARDVGGCPRGNGGPRRHREAVPVPAHARTSHAMAAAGQTHRRSRDCTIMRATASSAPMVAGDARQVSIGFSLWASAPGRSGTAAGPCLRWQLLILVVITLGAAHAGAAKASPMGTGPFLDAGTPVAVVAGGNCLSQVYRLRSDWFRDQCSFGG